MEREISRKVAIGIILVFLIISIVVGAFGVASEEVRVAVAFPIFVAGSLVTLRDVMVHHPLRWETVVGALLVISGSVIVGYQPIADAEQHSALGIIILGSSAIGLAALVPLAASYFSRKALNKGNRSSSAGIKPRRRYNHSIPRK